MPALGATITESTPKYTFKAKYSAVPLRLHKPSSLMIARKLGINSGKDMKSYEVLARRYCAFLGENPDEVIEGLPIWRIALADLEAAVNALETFGISARDPLSEVEFPTDEDPNTSEGSSKKVRPKLRRVA
jgi:hypothetical protein